MSSDLLFEIFETRGRKDIWVQLTKKYYFIKLRVCWELNLCYWVLCSLCWIDVFHVMVTTYTIITIKITYETYLTHNVVFSWWVNLIHIYPNLYLCCDSISHNHNLWDMVIMSTHIIISVVLLMPFITILDYKYLGVKLL